MGLRHRLTMFLDNLLKLGIFVEVVFSVATSISMRAIKFLKISIKNNEILDVDHWLKQRIMAYCFL
ncbi:MAG: hypothetical protein ACTSVI_05030 [Promethearchaeota archaeon]